MTLTLHATRHVQTPLIYIETVDCTGAHPHDEEEIAPEPELVFIRQGLFTRRDHHGEAIADVNHVLFFDRDRPYEVAHPLPGGDSCTVFHLRADALRELMARFDPVAAAQPRLSFPTGCAPLDARQQLAHHRLLRAAQAGASELALEEAALALFEAVLGTAYDAPPAGRSSPAGHADLAAEVKVYLSRVFRRKVLLDDVARAVYVSPYHLARLFKEMSERTIHRYLVDLRLHAALDPLADRRTPITDIALDHGFRSHSHFTTAFRRAFGLTPSAFRRAATARQVRALAETRKISKV